MESASELFPYRRSIRGYDGALLQAARRADATLVPPRSRSNSLECVATEYNRRGRPWNGSAVQLATGIRIHAHLHCPPSADGERVTEHPCFNLGGNWAYLTVDLPFRLNLVVAVFIAVVVGMTAQRLEQSRR